MKTWILPWAFVCCACSSETATVASVPDLAAPAAKDAGPKAPHGPHDDLDLPRQVYKRAYEQARKDITHSNARNRLEQIDEQIEREKDMMR